MKRIVFIAICVLGLICFSSCRSTSESCGLAENITKQTNQLQQPSALVLVTDVS